MLTIANGESWCYSATRQNNSENNCVVDVETGKSEIYYQKTLVAVKSSIAVEDAVENRGLYRVFVSRLF